MSHDDDVVDLLQRLRAARDTAADPALAALLDEAAAMLGAYSDPDNPPLTNEQLSKLRPAREVLGGAFVDAWNEARRGGEIRVRIVPNA
jgi:hypothetical protein